MSDIFGKGASALAGGSNTQSSSTNQAFPILSGPLQGILGTGGQAGSQIADMLGLNGNASQSQGFNNWKNSTGYQFGLDQGMQSITGNAAASGLVDSGGNEKALQTYGQNYANTQYGNYMSQLQGLLGSGLQGAGVLAGAGNTSQSSGVTTNNAFGSQGPSAKATFGSML